MRGLLRTSLLGLLGISMILGQSGCGGTAKVADDVGTDWTAGDNVAEIDSAPLPDAKLDVHGETSQDLLPEIDEDKIAPDTADLGPDVVSNRPTSAGQIVISEFMAQSTVGNDAGEWVELYNASAFSLDVAGCFLKDAATDSVPLTGSLVIGPGDFLTLGVSNDPAVNGGLEPDFVMTGYLLDNYGDTILLECDGVEIDKVVYEGNWVINGVARQLSNDKLDAVLNDVKANWCLAGFNYGGKGKLGSPGKANEVCVVVDACQPNPCTGAPASVCQDGITLKKSKVPGSCTVVNNQPSCEFETETVDCSIENKICKNGACVVPPDPCNPNPCTTPPQPTCDGDLANTFEVPGACSNDNGTAKCDYTPKQINCALQGKVCFTGACQYEGQGLPPSQAGQVIVSEFMAKSQSGTDNGEWIEFYNTTGTALDLNGCALKDKANENIVIAEPLVIPAGGYLLFAKSDDPALNHGLEPDYIASFAMANDGDKIILVCNGVEIDRIEYTGTWVATGAATQLNSKSMDGLSNDTLINWCPATTVYGTNNMLGTPGTSNIECQIPVTIYKCRLQEPLDVTQEAGTDLTVLGRVAAFSITDLTTGNDTNPMLKGQAGYGPVNSNPATSTSWNWVDAAPFNGWDALAAGELDMDQYTATYSTPGTGNYHHAYRFSVDGGNTWTYCDRNAGSGADGSENGYQISNAGTLKTTPGANPCDPNPCTTPEADVCSADGLSVITWITPGLCTVVEGAATCNYTQTTIACALDGKTCINGSCVAEGEGNTPTAKGQVLVTEFMPQSQSGTDEGEWIELYNNTGTVLDLGGCSVTDLEATTTFPSPYLMLPGEYLVLARSSDPVKNHGLPFDYIYSGIALSNSGDQIILVCNETTIDQVEYTSAWFALGVAPQLDPASFDDMENDLLENWCLATQTYGTAGKMGTPGAANTLCAPPVVPTADWCRFQHPAYVEVAPSAQVSAYGRVFEPGATDASALVDVIAGLKAQAGFGPVGSDPATDATWTWKDGAANPAWDGTSAGEPANDEYMAVLTAPAAEGSYAMAWRFSLDNGSTWLYCDLDKGEGMDGSEDGYSAVNAAELKVVQPIDPCTPNPCQVAPSSICDSGTVARHYTAPGTCSVVGEIAECLYASTTENCALTGKTCVLGVCRLPGEGDRPMAGEVFLTEFMPNPVDATDDGEWIEFYNVASVPLDLGGCILKDLTTNNHTIVGPLVVQPGDFVVLARSGDPAINHGLTSPYVYSNFMLANTGDTIILDCDGATVDSVTYTSALVSVGVAAQLSSLHFDDVENDLEANWCFSKATFGTDNQFGSPGSDNGDCAPAKVDWCRFQWPATATMQTNEEFDVYGRIFEDGLTDLSAGIDPIAGMVIQAGFGPDGSTPDDTWTWMAATATPAWDGTASGEPKNDEYMALLKVATAGEYDMAFRVSLSTGLWTYCDLDKGEGMDGSENGYAPADSAVLTVTPQVNLCDPNPCVGEAPVCSLDGTKVILTVSPGDCATDGVEYVCSYNKYEEDCVTLGKLCEEGACVAPPKPTPAAGEVIFTEIMVRAVAGTTDNGEYVELYNTTTEELDISGCLFKDSAASFAIPANTVLAAGDYLVLAKGSDPAGNFGVPFDFAWGTGILLSNSGEAVSFECATVVIDTVTYPGTWDDIEGASVQLKTSFYNATDNDNAANWCTGGFSLYGTANKRGTPGLVNDNCVAPAVDWCRFQAPLDADIPIGGSVTTYGRVNEAGKTDVSAGVDALLFFKGQAGFGPDGSTPDATWTWVDAVGTPGWDAVAMGEPANDEYTAALVPTTAGTYDMAYRFSLDNGATWTYCDLDKGEGFDGSEDGYLPANAASLVVQPPADPCSPNPCTTGKPAECNIDNTKAIEYIVPGTCTNVGGVAECAYASNEIDCVADGKVCQNGACVTTGGTPKPYFSEYIEGGSFNKAVEIYNGGTAALDLSTCEVRVYGNGATTATSTLPLTAGSLAVGAVWVYCNNQIAVTTECDQLNTNLNFNGDDAVALVCGGTTYDVIGKIGQRPTPAWIGGTVSTLDMTLRVRCSITGGDTDGSNDYDPSVAFAAFAKDDLTNLGTYTCVN